MGLIVPPQRARSKPSNHRRVTTPRSYGGSNDTVNLPKAWSDCSLKRLSSLYEIDLLLKFSEMKFSLRFELEQEEACREKGCTQGPRSDSSGEESTTI
eukprot:6212313-Pleurochrysis_carterae.AAC.9